MVFVAYQDCGKELGNRIYLICLFSFILYGIAMFFNYYFLVPKFLLKGKYVVYSILLFIIVFLLPTLSTLQEYLVRNALNLPHRITSYTNPLILVDNLASVMIILICFFGVSAFALFRQWISDKEHINQMEYEHLTSEVDKLKGQITPKFLSQTLSNASVIVESNPERASELLMQLGQLLRYQLYDCNRERVLLKSEIGFLGNFLQLKQMNKSDFKYEIIINGDLNNVFVSPMLFISLIQDMIEDSTLLSLTFTFENSSLLFLCKSDSQKKLFDDEVYLIKRRLELQYPKHVLLLEEGIIELRMEDLK